MVWLCTHPLIPPPPPPPPLPPHIHTHTHTHTPPNTDDWKSIFGDPTKFGLGFFSVCFDLLFMLQHYVLFRKPRQKKSGYEKIGDSDNNDPREYNEKTKLIDDDKQNDPHKNKLKQLLVILHLA